MNCGGPVNDPVSGQGASVVDGQLRIGGEVSVLNDSEHPVPTLVTNEDPFHVEVTNTDPIPMHLTDASVAVTIADAVDVVVTTDVTVNPGTTFPISGSVSIDQAVRSAAFSVVTVGTTATPIITGGWTKLRVNNQGSAPIFLREGNTVSTTNGVALAPGESLLMDDCSNDLYGIVATGTQPLGKILFS